MIGRTIDHYRIDAELGAGGMGVVYKGYDLRLDRLVAIKVLPLDKLADPAGTQRFIREARAASALNHPGIVTIHDMCSDAGMDFIVMEYILGKTLAESIPSKGMRAAEAMRYAEGQFDIFIVSSAGGKPRHITSHPAMEHVPNFSRDGKWIYFSSTRSGTSRLSSPKIEELRPLRTSRGRRAGDVQIRRMPLISRRGGTPNKRWYSRLNCEALS